MKLIKTLVFLIGTINLFGCGDGIAPPEVERAISESHSAKSRMKSQAPIISPAEPSIAKKSKSRGNNPDNPPETPQFSIIPGKTTKTE